MSGTTEPTTTDRCLLCGSARIAEHSVAEPNLYSEMLAVILNMDEEQLLDKHPNYRCVKCGLIFKRRWFPSAAISELFAHVVPTHPRGWDAVRSRFSAARFERVVDRWVAAHRRSSAPELRKAQRELTSILDSITQPVGYDPDRAAAAIADGDVEAFRTMASAVAASIGEPEPFKRFSGFRSTALRDYLHRRTDGLRAYAELGCPLWGLLPLAAESTGHATFISREEPNYWGRACVVADEHCAARLLRDPRIRTATWTGPERFSLIGLFQYLDHVADPVEFLRELFGKADSVALILDGGNRPVAIQHVTGWNEQCLAYVAKAFSKRLHVDFDEIRSSGNVLYLLTEGL